MPEKNAPTPRVYLVGANGARIVVSERAAARGARPREPWGTRSIGSRNT